MIGGNTSFPEQFAAKVKEQLLSTGERQISEEAFARMKKKKIGRTLRAMNSLEYVANQFVDYHRRGINFFEVIPYIEELTAHQINEFLATWIDESRLAVCTIQKG